MNLSPHTAVHPRESTETYASTESSTDGGSEYVAFPIEELEGPEHQSNSKLQASTPRNFGEYFPSQKRLLIKHDDTTYDGDMNLRIEVETTQGLRSSKVIVQLFHLRMHDENREFSLRRYCRTQVAKFASIFADASNPNHLDLPQGCI